MRKITLTILLFVAAWQGYSQIPPGYYNSALGLDSIYLQQALHDIIDSHTVVSYSSIKNTHHGVTDRKANGEIWDMYSDVPGGTPPYVYHFVSADQCGNYAGEGDCYNREHSFPQSWFNSANPMKTDLFHVYPTDGYVNGRRSSYPYGEVSNPTWTSLNGSKLGPNTFPGSNGTCFEPIDEYKGDFARTYFYMAVRYYNEDNGWQSNDMVNGSQLKPWALDMLYQWHLADTVSQKEMDRNNAIYLIQNNRNPFIDRPDWVDSLWFPSQSSGVGIQNSQQDDWKIFPNPARNEVEVRLEKGSSPRKVNLMDLNGRLLYSYSLVAYQQKQIINLQPYPSGLYFIQLVSTEKTVTKKLIIQD
jgi:endonuclease I